MGLTLDPPELPQIVSTSGLDADAVRAMVQLGEFRRVRRGALTRQTAGRTAWETQELEALALVTAVNRKLTNGAVVSHSSAALIHGLWLYQVPAVVHVTQRSRSNGRSAPDIRRHRAVLDEEWVTTVHGVRVTTIERTIVECSRTMHPRDALVVADAGMRALTRPDRRDRAKAAAAIAELRSRLLAMVGKGPGHGRRRARVVIEVADPYSESPMESVLRWTAISRGLPPPAVQAPVRTRGGTFYVDLGWVWRRRAAAGSWEVVCRVLVEYDGDMKYRPGSGIVHSAEETSAALVAEKRREDLIREDRANCMLRVSRAELRDPDALVARMLAAMPAATARTLHPVPELLVRPHPALR